MLSLPHCSREVAVEEGALQCLSVTGQLKLFSAAWPLFMFA